MATVRVFLGAIAVAGLLACGAMMLCIGVLARNVPDLPAHARINPFNVLALPERWTPQIRTLHQWAVRCGLVFVASILVILATAFLAPGD